MGALKKPDEETPDQPAPAAQTDLAALFKAYTDSAPKMPSPQLPQQADPAIVQQAQQRASLVDAVHGLAGLRTVTPFDIRHGTQPSVMPGFDSAKQAALAPLAAEQARVQNTNAQGDVMNKFLMAQHSSDVSGLKGMLSAYMASQKLGETVRKNKADEDLKANEVVPLAPGAGAVKKHGGAPVSVPGGGGGLSPEALDQAVKAYATTGKIDVGRDPGNVMRKQIMEGYAKQFPGGNPGSNAADFGSDKASLGSLQKQADNQDAYEKMAGANLDRFLESSKGLIDSKAPWINKPLRSLEFQAGSPEQAAANAARQIAANEVAKVLNPGSGVTSDHARAEASGLLGQDLSLAQLHKVVKDIIRPDMQNRRDANTTQLQIIKDRIAKHGQTAAPAQVHVRDKKSGEMRAFDRATADQILQAEPTNYEEVK